MSVFHTAILPLRHLVLLAAGVLLLCACAQAARHDEFRPYDEKADASAAIAARLANNPARKRILLTFGANWCSDSRALESRFQSPVLAELLEREFLVLYIDVGMFHHNLDIIARYGNPIDEGIPSVVLLDPAGNTLFVSHGGLSSADSMSDAAIMDFFTRLAADGRVD
ncbi:MAG: thioredoxin family protein [Pseudomonadales bacterium]|nr:thioredoxin family protein [Pseudomonadales bacterium]